MYIYRHTYKDTYMHIYIHRGNTYIFRDIIEQETYRHTYTYTYILDTYIPDTYIHTLSYIHTHVHT